MNLDQTRPGRRASPERRVLTPSLALGLLMSLPTVALAEGAGCRAEAFAGRWRNAAIAEGSDVVQAEIRVACAATPRIDLALTVRCLHFECAWRAVPAMLTSDADRLALQARYVEERVERFVTARPPVAGRMRMTVTTRFLRTPLEPRAVDYELLRVED